MNLAKAMLIGALLSARSARALELTPPQAKGLQDVQAAARALAEPWERRSIVDDPYKEEAELNGWVARGFEVAVDGCDAGFSVLVNKRIDFRVRKLPAGTKSRSVYATGVGGVEKVVADWSDKGEVVDILCRRDYLLTSWALIVHRPR